MRVLRTGVLSALMVLGCAAMVEAQQYGTVTGLVTDGATGGALAGVQIQVAGTNIGGLTNASGKFLLTRVPAGQQTLRAVRIGYAQVSQTVTVTADGTTAANFTLKQSAVPLEGLMVTAMGVEQRTREVGVSVGRIQMRDVSLADNSDVSAALQGRVPGVTVTEAGGTTGTGTRIRIRGSTSVSLDNDPLVVIDGVRASNTHGNTIGVGGQDPQSALDQIAPEDISKIEVLKGPAASAMYGTAAANGVIVVTTRRGTAGTTRWRAYIEGAQLTDPNRYPANYQGWCTYTSGGAAHHVGGCDTGYFLYLQSAGVSPTMDSIQVFNPLEDKGLSSYPFQNGARQHYGLSAQGGTERVTYYLSGDWSHEKGVYKDVSDLRDLNLRTNVDAQLTDKIQASVHMGYIDSNLRLPQNDNNVLGILPSALLGGATQESAYGFFTLPELKAINTQQKVRRFIGSSRVTINALTWLSFSGTVGMDLIQRHDNETIPPQRVFYSTLPQGERTSNRLDIGTYTAQGNAEADFKLMENLGSTTNAGVQYVDNQYHETDAYGRGLLAGCYSLNCVAAGYNVGETNTDSKTIGVYVSELLSYNDRVYLTGALRGDDNSAFGKNLNFTLYPSVNLSWIIGEEPWFPKIPQLSLLRLRAGYGVAGLQPGFRTARRYLNPASTVINGSVVPAFTFGGVGNPNLKPEISKELELGADLGFLQDRFGFEATYYNKKGYNVLIARDLPPSLGVATTQTVNLGKDQNTGIELLARGTVVKMDNVVWDASVSYSTVNNKLLSLGTDPNTGQPIQPIIFGLGGNTQRFQEGFPMGAYFARSYTYKDTNGDGYISMDEVTLADTASYQGTPFPTRLATIQSSVTLFKRLRLSALMDYQGGYKLYNGTADFRCAAFYNCHDAYAGYQGVKVSLARQAAYIADAYGPSGGTVAGYFEDGTFWKLREVTASISLPRSWANKVQAEGLQLTLAGRNLGTWTKYRGPDPEINGAGSGSNFNTFDFLSQPPVRYYTIRLDLTF